MIVGNGPLAANAADAIDAADLVVRFNDCASAGAGGQRTDIVAVCNTGRPAKWMLSSPEWRAKPAVRAAREIWSVRDPRKFAALREPLALSHPGLADFCDDYTDQFATFAADAGKAHVIIDQSVHSATEVALGDVGAEPYVVPSSGMIVTTQLLRTHPADTIVIAGFSHTGWSGHPFAAERRLMESHIAAGRLRRLENIADRQQSPHPSKEG
jgi:hypothetical protein